MLQLYTYASPNGGLSCSIYASIGQVVFNVLRHRTNRGKAEDKLALYWHIAFHGFANGPGFICYLFPLATLATFGLIDQNKWPQQMAITTLNVCLFWQKHWVTGLGLKWTLTMHKPHPYSFFRPILDHSCALTAIERWYYSLYPGSKFWNMDIIWFIFSCFYLWPWPGHL